MATAANPTPGAMPTADSSDPFVSPPTYAPRYASLDLDQISSYPNSSPRQAKRTLEAHLKDTDRRIQDASRLGTTLLQQRKELTARLQEVENVQPDDEVPQDLRTRLADLEREYNEVGKESARAFLPKAKIDPSGTPSALTGSGRESPTKASAPSRRQRNQPTNRVHDIEFATEISTSLLAQVRQLQAALSLKDEELKDTTAAKLQLETEGAGLVQKLKHLNDNEQRYKDENWNLETRLQELEASHKEVSEREQRAAQSLKVTQSEKAAAQRDLDDLKLSHERLNEEHAIAKRQQETDLHGLRRDATAHETERSTLQKKLEELTAQNSELARAVSYRFTQPGGATDTEFVSADEGRQLSDGTPDEAPESPVKGTPARHGMLESETLKSSLNHAHRMIQNLKNNIHREKTEKIELKRMLQEARDELETRRGDSSGAVGANVGKKRRSDLQLGANKFGKPGTRTLGANRGSTTEILADEPDWEDHDGASTPTKSMNMPGAFLAGAGGAALGYAAGISSTGEETESTDAAFETATERGDPSDAFETGRESADDDESEELTETESSTVNRNETASRAVSGLVGVRAGNRQSFQSTASDDELVQTPLQVQQQPQKYRLRLNRNSKRDRVTDLARDSPSGQSPASSIGTPQPAGQSLGDELDAMDEGTPSRFTDSAAATPETQRMVSPGPTTSDISTPILSSGSGDNEMGRSASSVILAPANKPTYADAGMMTEPMESELAPQDSSFAEKAVEVVGGALAGFGLGMFAGERDRGDREGTQLDTEAGAEDFPITSRKPAMIADSPTLGDQFEPISLKTATEEIPAAPVLTQSNIITQETEPVTPPKAAPREKRTTIIPAPIETVNLPKDPPFGFSPVTAQHVEPVAPRTPLLPKRSSKRVDTLDTVANGDGQGENEPYSDKIPGTDAARPGAGFFASAEQMVQPRTVLGQVPTNIQRPFAAHGERDSTGMMPLVLKKPTSDGGAQTDVSGEDIEDMVRNKNRISTLAELPMIPGATLPGGRRSIDGSYAGEPALLRTPRRPTSSSSMRNRPSSSSNAPPLPEDHTLKIAQAQKVPGAAPVGTMGPPLMPASAYRQSRPRTPVEGARTLSRDGTTPRAKQVQSPTETQRSRQDSMSSFASEVDERINGRSQFMYPEGVQPATDPRMIQAITQTMIGEYLWKYTRKAGRSNTSNSRHRRFFWVHPYTRTLYWSTQDPSTAGRDMLKAKSVAIETVRVISDDNAYPPGLHRKSIVVITPGREVVFTAPTGQRHETWFNALSYLLLRTEQERAEAEEGLNQEDINEFNPGFGSSIRRSISRITGRSQSRVSLSSYNSRTTRASSPPRDGRVSAISATGTHNRPAPSPSPVPQDSMSSRTSTVRDSNAGVLSSITSKFISGNAQRASNSTSRGRGAHTGTRGRQPSSEIYNASVAADSAEDVRAQLEKQTQDADRLENVRACCDGKHDVGSLSRTSRHASFGHRFSAHTHAHHAHPQTEPIQES